MKSCAFVGLGVHALLGAWLLGSTISGCSGGATPTPKSSDAASPVVSATPSSSPPEDASPAAEGQAPAEPEASEKEEVSPPAKDPNAQREVRYVVAPEGLKVEAAGVRFLVAADAKQIAQGWGVKLSVKAESADGKEHVLLSPKNGPLAFAAAVFKKGSSEAERIPDGREGEGELTVAPGSPISFSRQFPSPGGRVLAIGETLDMEVALWGLGETKDDRRPVKQFVHVKMKVEKGKPRAIVEPPASAK